MVRLCQTGKNYLGEHELGISFFDVVGPTTDKMVAAVTPHTLDLKQI
jgi:hypothetical protein